MSNKKNQHKGKPKESTKQSEDFTSRKSNPEKDEEEYVTVVDFEDTRKYNKRLIQNNWAKYEAPLSDFECDVEEDQPKTDDFSSLLKTASSDCSHFQFSSEKLWKSETSVPASEIFNIDLDLLSSGLACVPFYERMGLDANELSEEDKKKMDKAAEDNWKKYELVRDKKTKKPESENSKVNSKNTLEELFQVKMDANKEPVKTPEPERTENEPIPRQKLLISENDENLEDWLDSVLDD